MRRLAALGALLAGIAVVAALPAAAAAEGPVKTFSQEATLGFYRGRLISYLDFGPVKLAAGNNVAPIWTVTNGAAGQHNIVDTVPGQTGYTPLWAVNMVTWKGAMTPHVLGSAAAVHAAQKAGEVTVKATRIVVNCPVL